MKIYPRALAFILLLGVAPAVAAVEKPAAKRETSAAAKPATAAELLEEFKTAKYSYLQSQFGEKLVVLGDKSVIGELLPLLSSIDRHERCNVGRVLAGLGDDRGFFVVLAELNDKSKQPRKNNRLHNDNDPVAVDRDMAAHVLGRIGDKRAVPALIEALKDKTIGYRAAKVLGHLGDARAIVPLQAILNEADAEQRFYEGEFDKRLWAAHGLLELGHPDGSSAMLRLLRLKVQPWIVRHHAVMALADFNVREASPQLIETLRGDVVEVRVSAALALGHLRDKTAIPALQKALIDADIAISRPTTDSRDNTGNLLWYHFLHEASTKALKELGAK